MTEFWLISAPGEKTCQQTYETLINVTNKQNDLCKNSKFHIPDLKVGTLDQLVGLSDELTKLDGYVESVCHKLAASLQDTLENKHNSVVEHLQANGQDLPTYLQKFNWDMAKYPIKQSLKSLHDIISKKISDIGNELKTKTGVYNSLKGNLQTLERKQTGSLLIRNLGELVKKEHFITGSEYLVTLLVVVPKGLYKDWTLKYENLTKAKPEKNLIVPRSSQLIYEDNDHGLFNVTLFQKEVEELKQAARENKFVVRDFQYNEEDIAKGKNELVKLEKDKNKQHQFLFRWVKVNFSEAFIAWIHVKALRLFVESVLRYGLPVNFLAFLILPHKKQARKLRETLNQLYAHLDTSIGQGPVDEIPGFSIGSQEYFKINIDMFS